MDKAAPAEDPDVLLVLLEEKERDLELAAHIGKQLLEQNKQLAGKCECIESKLKNEIEQSRQLQHELAMKESLLKFYIDDLENDNQQQQTGGTLNEISGDRSKIKFEHLQWKVTQLEDYNKGLKSQVGDLREQLDNGERKESALVEECLHELKEARQRCIQLECELNGKNEECAKLQRDVSTVLSQTVEVQRKSKLARAENEQHEILLAAARDSQKELTQEVMELQDRYQQSVMYLREAHSELHQLRARESFTRHPIGYPSLAVELEQSLMKEYELNQSPKPDRWSAHMLHAIRLADRSHDSSGHWSCGDSFLSDDDPSRSPSALASQPLYEANSACATPKCEEEKAISSAPISQSEPNSKSSHGNSKLMQRVRIVKPIEGSATLNHWKSLATPSLDVVCSEQEGILMSLDHQEEILISSEDELDDVMTSSTYTFRDSTVLHPDPDETFLLPFSASSSTPLASASPPPPLESFSTGATTSTDLLDATEKCSFFSEPDLQSSSSSFSRFAATATYSCDVSLAQMLHERGSLNRTPSPRPSATTSPKVKRNDDQQQMLFPGGASLGLATNFAQLNFVEPIRRLGLAAMGMQTQEQQPLSRRPNYAPVVASTNQGLMRMHSLYHSRDETPGLLTLLGSGGLDQTVDAWRFLVSSAG